MNPTTKATNISEVTSSMNRGSSSADVKLLQTWLANNGYPEVKPDGIFGPVTESAVKKFQSLNGLKPDGLVGPLTLNKLKSIATTTETGSKTKEEVDREYNEEVAKHPVFAGNSADALSYAAETGDFSNLLNDAGKPFSQVEQERAMKEAESALAPGFDIAKQKETADVETTLAQKQLDYNKYLDEQGASFEEDKATLDQNAADQGVLFSGGRIEKQKKLGEAYEGNLAYKNASMANDISSTARDYQSMYGDKAAKNLSNYYKVGGNVYNPNVARGGVKKSSLSSMYNPSGLGYQGTEVVKNKAETAKRAAGLLWNKGNKLVASGLNNQYK